MTYTDRRCRDCSIHTSSIGEYYMVTNQVWEEAGGSTEFGWGMLCIGCLEKRLGRQLVSTDFLDVYLNGSRFSIKSERLLNRLTAKSC